MSDPITVTLVDPVPTAFTCTKELGATADIDTTDEIVLIRAAAVATTPNDRMSPVLGLLTNDVALSHCVLQVVLPPRRAVGVQDSAPALLPTTVTDVDPVEATFVATAELSSTESYVNAPVVLAAATCTVDAAVLTVPTLADALAATLVSDRHTDTAIVLPPRRTTWLLAWWWP